MRLLDLLARSQSRPIHWLLRDFPGLPVARVVKVERRADSAFARIYCAPLAQVQGARHVVVLKPLGDNELPRPDAAPAAPATKRGGRK